MNGNKLFAVINIALIVFMSVLFLTLGSEKTWRMFGVPARSPSFMDIRTITGASDSIASGFDPLEKNPGDPWGRAMNYPRIWTTLATLGINQSHTVYLGFFFIIVFLISHYLYAQKKSKLTAVLLNICLLSPAVLLGLERGNNDLLVFFLLALAIWIYHKSDSFSLMIIVLSFFLKLFPIFASIIFLKEKKRNSLMALGLITTIVLLYIVFTYEDLLLIFKMTQKSGSGSYGVNVFYTRFQEITQNMLPGFFRYIPYLIVLAVLCGALFLGRKLSGNLTAGFSLQANSFKIGSSIYIGTFLFGYNYDYRLMFLLFTIPYLVSMIEKKPKSLEKTLALVTVSAIMFSLWSLFLKMIVGDISYGKHLVYFLDEMGNWLTFTGLAVLLFQLFPKWILFLKTPSEN
jgi:hypothetical protein